MWKCRRCGKPVYFAERRQSIGFDWHRECLKCYECGKVLNPGQHAEHKETPYCHVPCYSALFGPKLFGHGSQVESHQSFGKRSGHKLLLQQQELEKRTREYNDYQNLKIQNNQSPSTSAIHLWNGSDKSPPSVQDAQSPTSSNTVSRNSTFGHSGGKSRLEITSREVNGRLVLEGVLRICWGVEHSIRIKEFDDKRLIAKRSNQESANAKLNCDKGSSMLCMTTDSTPEGYMSLTYSYSEINKEEESNLENVVKRNGKKSIGFQRHSVHQINISNKDLNFQNNFDKEAPTDKIEDYDNTTKSKISIIDDKCTTPKLIRASLLSPSQSLKKDSKIPPLLETSEAFTIDRSLEKYLKGPTNSDHKEDTDSVNSANHEVSDVKIDIDWKKFDKLQTKVARRSSDVTLEKMHAGERRENETICASLKKYQTLPPKVALHSLPGYSEYRLHRYAPLMDLATLRSTSSSGSNSSSLKSSIQTDFEDQYSNTDISSTIKNFVESEHVSTIDDSQNIMHTEKENSLLKSDSPDGIKLEERSDNFLKPESKAVRGTGPRALRRRPGRKFSEKRKANLQRKSSFNGHWYNRDTSVFTPPKDSYMSVWTTSLTRTPEVVKMLLEKYQIQIDNSDRFALFVVKDNGERRRLTDSECPLLTRVNLGPHEDAAKIYVMDNRTTDIRHEVAQYLRFSYAELRAILNMFYEEEEGEIKRIKQKYKTIKDIAESRFQYLSLSQEQDEENIK